MAALAGGWRTETSPDGRVTMYVSPQGLRLSSSEFAQRYPVLKAYPESEWAAILHQTLDLANEAASSAPFGAGMAAGGPKFNLAQSRLPGGAAPASPPALRPGRPPAPEFQGGMRSQQSSAAPQTPPPADSVSSQWAKPYESGRYDPNWNYGTSGREMVPYQQPPAKGRVVDAEVVVDPPQLPAPTPGGNTPYTHAYGTSPVVPPGPSATQRLGAPIPPPPPGRAPMPVPVGVPPQGAQGGPGWWAQNWGKVATGAGLAAGGAASLLRGQSGQTPKQYGGMMSNSAQPGFDQWASEHPQEQAPQGQPQAPAPRGNGTERRNGYQAPRAAGAGAAQPAGQQNVAFAPNGSGGVSAHPNYYADMMNAADSGDAYARDQIRLTEQARQAAIEAQQRGDRYQFVPIRDYRNNRMTLVNANGADVVLDMSDPTHKAEYTRMLEKIGMNPAELQSWSMRASRPLMRYYAPAGGHIDTTPDFAFAPGTPQMGQPRQDMQPAGPAAPQAPQPGRTIRDLLDGPTPRPIMQPRRTIHSLDDMPPAPAQRHMEPDADQMGGPSDQDADNAKPPMSVGNYMSQYAPGDEELYRRLGKWDYDTEQPRTGIDRLQGTLTADLNKRAARQPLRQTARR